MLVSRRCLYLLPPLPLHLLDCVWNIKRSGGKARESLEGAEKQRKHGRPQVLFAVSLEGL